MTSTPPKKKKANGLTKPIVGLVFAPGQKNLRWSRFKKFEAEEMFKTVSQEVFPFIKNLHGGEDTAYSRHMKDAIFMHNLLQSANIQHKATSTALFTSLLQRAFRGEL